MEGDCIVKQGARPGAGCSGGELGGGGRREFPGHSTPGSSSETR